MNNFLIVLIDDDRISLLLTKSIVLKMYPDQEVIGFISPKNALEYLKGNTENGTRNIVIFLDINMPTISGWDILELLNEKEIDIKCIVYMLTSSIYKKDLDRAMKYDCVKKFISKPLTISKIKDIKFPF